MEFFFGVFDNDEVRNLPALKEEADRIDDAFRILVDGLEDSENGKIRREIEYNIGFEKFKEYLTAYANKMTIFHFSGHHGNEQLQLTDQLVNDAGVIKILNEAKRLKMVFLNGCCTDDILQQLSNVPIIIGTKKAVQDHHAKEISAKFYELLTQQLDNFTDLTKLKSCFEQAKGFSELAPKSTSTSPDTDANRDISERQSSTLPDTDYILQINEQAIDFDIRVTYYADLSKYPVKDKYKAVIYEWFDTINITDAKKPQEIFHSHYPKNFSYFLEQLSHEENLTSPASSTIGLERFNLIKSLFLALFDFLKNCAYSILWTILYKEPVKLPQEIKQEIAKQLELSWYITSDEKSLLDRLTHLGKLYQTIEELSQQDLSTAREFFKSSHQFLTLHSEKELSKWCEIFVEENNNKYFDAYYFLNAEKFLYFFVKYCSFLTDYQMASVYGSLFFKYRIEGSSYHYQVRYFQKGPFQDKVGNEIFKDQIYDVYSILLKDKRTKDANNPMILNLSPFYFDNNLEDHSADQIDLMCYDFYTNTDGTILASYRSLTNLNDPIHLVRDEEKYYSKSVRLYDHIETLLDFLK